MKVHQAILIWRSKSGKEFHIC